MKSILGMQNLSALLMNLVVELVIVNALLDIIKDLGSRSFKPLKGLAGIVGVDNVEIVIKDHEMSRIVDKMSNELLLNKGMSNRVKAIRVMTSVLAEIFDMGRPPIRKIRMGIHGLRRRNMRKVVINS